MKTKYLLKEILDMGAIQATKSLELMIGNTITTPPSPQVKTLALSEVGQYLGGNEQLVYGVLFKTQGALSASLFMIFTEQAVKDLLHYWLGKINSTNDLDDYDISALKELSNIAVGSYLTAISQITKHKILCSIPALAHDMLGALLDQVLIETAKQDDEVIVLHNEFIVKKQRISGQMLFIVDPLSLQNIMEERL